MTIPQDELFNIYQFFVCNKNSKFVHKEVTEISFFKSCMAFISMDNRLGKLKEHKEDFFKILNKVISDGQKLTPEIKEEFAKMHITFLDLQKISNQSVTNDVFLFDLLDLFSMISYRIGVETQEEKETSHTLYKIIKIMNRLLNKTNIKHEFNNYFYHLVNN